MIGTSFSPRHAAHLGLDPANALERVGQLGIRMVRLGAYWDELQPTTDSFEFSSLLSQLDFCEREQLQVVLTVGAKAPRWPEFYDPAWTKNLSPLEYEDRLLTFVEVVVKQVSHYRCLSTWQVENEALDPSGPEGRKVSPDLLAREVQLVRKLDSRHRPIVLTAWGNKLRARQTLPQLAPLADILGIDLYPRVFSFRRLGRNFYDLQFSLAGMVSAQLRELTKPVWISELQAEPWEESDAGYRSENPRSFNPHLLIKNWQWAQQFGAEQIFLWGCEYWLWREDLGDPRYVQIVRRLCGKQAHVAR